MSYANPLAGQIVYNFGLHDFGAGAGAFSFKGPPGRRGRLEDVGVAVTETFTTDTTPGYVRVGSGADPDAYAEACYGIGSYHGFLEHPR